MFKEKVCRDCSSIFKPIARAQLLCTDCRRKKDACQKEYRRKKAYEKFCERQILLGREYVIGVGKGGSNKRGKDNNLYINGYSEFRSVSRKIRKEVKSCQHCGRDLSAVSPHEKCVHHKNRDRTDNSMSNLILLCKRCHQIEHTCWENLKGATTIPKGSTPQAYGGGSAEHT